MTVTDAGLDGDLNTSGDNGTTNRTFTVMISAVNDTPTLGAISDQNLVEDAVCKHRAGRNQSGREQRSSALTVTATSSNPASSRRPPSLIPARTPPDS